MTKINREEYMDWLIRWKDRQIIKVVFRRARCRKSTMFDMFQGIFTDRRVSRSQIIMLNFEDIEYEEITDYQKLYYYIKERLLPDPDELYISR